MADIKNIVEEIKKLTIVEVSELVKALEEEFGVSAAAPVAVAAAPVAGAAEAAAEEKSEFNVFLKEVGANKIAVIKIVREVTGLGLSEAKAIVDGAPKMIKENVAAAEAKEMEAKFKEAGAVVELK
ncbi:MAG: 50S ribosomal protein L7/L12 [Clostridiales bacterium]|nr:50S ribosomal protein L7/L12 [Clostridiales bacterium]